jgi:large subunit ribosomal protein L21
MVTMYAVIQTGGKQYKVALGDTVRVEKLPVAEGDVVAFDQVLLIADGGSIQVGKPLLAGQKVSGHVLRHGRGAKIEIIKFRRRKHYRKQAGHRQDFTEVEITGIAGKTVERKKRAPVKTESHAAAPKKEAAKKATTKTAAPKKKAATKKKASSKK